MNKTSSRPTKNKTGWQIGQTAFVWFATFETNGKLKSTEVRRVIITDEYPNYCGKGVLHFGASKIGKSGYGLAYKPERFHKTEQEAYFALRESLERKIQKIKDALESLPEFV